MKKRPHSHMLALSEDASLQEIRAACDALEAARGPRRGEGQFREKLRALWLDRRPFGIRLSLAVLCSLAFAFTFVVFGPYELYVQSVQFLNFSFFPLALTMGAAGVVTFALLCAILCLLRGKVFNCALSSLFSVTLAGYLQRNFLNIDHGPLDGHSVNWAGFASVTVLNFLIWCAIFAGVLLLMYFSRRIWTQAVRLLLVMLIGAQAVALLVMLWGNPILARQDELYVSTDGMENVTTGDNVVFFLLDCFDNDYADHLLEANPQWREELSGFTYYRNFTGSYTRTTPSVAYLLTGVKCDYTMAYDDYFAHAYASSSFLNDIRAAGNRVRIYTDEAYAFGSAANGVGLTDNIYSTAEDNISYPTMLRMMLSLSAYVYAPEAFKPFFWMYTGDLTAINSIPDGYRINDPQFWREMNERGIAKEDAPGMFTFYHLSGAHSPFIMDEQGKEVGQTFGEQAMYAQAAGNMNMIFRYLDALREAGLYDNTTVIISADHGRSEVMEYPEGAYCPSLFIKPAGADSAAVMAVSDKQVCQDSLRASIISYFGLDTSAYGRTIESIAEDEEIARYFWFEGCDETSAQWEANMITFEIRGDANAFENWTEIDRIPIQNPYYGTVPAL